jgi:hypothetical protein
MSVEHQPSAPAGGRVRTPSASAVPLVWALVLLGAIVPPVAITYGCWQLYRTAAQLATGLPIGAYERSASSIATIAGIAGVALLVQAVVGLVFLGWLHRARTNAKLLSPAPHRYSPGWAIGAWFVPVVNLVLPRVIVADVLRASRSDGAPTVAAVNGWWIATLLARTAHLAAWVLLVVTFLDGVSQSGFLTAAVIHTSGTLCSVTAGLLLGRIAVGISIGQHHLAARAPEPIGEQRTGDEPEPSPAPASDWRASSDFGYWLTTGLSFMRRSAAPLLVLAAGAAAADALARLYLMASLESTSGALGLGSSSVGIGTASGFLNSGPDWTAYLVTLAALIVRAIAYSASIVVVVRLGSGDVASVLVGLRVAVRRLLPLLGWLLVTIGTSAIGLLLLVVPGVYVLVVGCSTLIAVVTLEERGIRRCFELVRGRFWPTAARFVPLLAVAQAWWIGTDAISFQLIAQPAGAVLLYAVLDALGYAFVAAFLAATYTELKAHDDQRAERTEDLDAPRAAAHAVVPGAVLVEPEVRANAPYAERGRHADAAVPQHPDRSTTARQADPADPGERSGRTPLLLAISAGGVGITVLTAFATIGVMHVVGAAPVPDQAVVETPPPTSTIGPVTAPSAADVLAATLAQSRRDGSGTFSLTSRRATLPWSETIGTFGYRGDAVSVSAIHSREDFYVREIVVVNDERWLKFVFNPGEEGSWNECFSIEEDPCRYTAYMQDFADPVQLLARAGPAAQLTASNSESIDGVTATRYEFEFSPESALATEADPLWQARFRNSWLGAGPIQMWVDSRSRLLQMAVGSKYEPHHRVKYADWGGGNSIRHPTAN